METLYKKLSFIEDFFRNIDKYVKNYRGTKTRMVYDFLECFYDKCVKDRKFPRQQTQGWLLHYIIFVLLKNLLLKYGFKPLENHRDKDKTYVKGEIAGKTIVLSNDVSFHSLNLDLEKNYKPDILLFVDKPEPKKLLVIVELKNSIGEKGGISIPNTQLNKYMESCRKIFKNTNLKETKYLIIYSVSDKIMNESRSNTKLHIKCIKNQTKKMCNNNDVIGEFLSDVEKRLNEYCISS